jgi:predicted AlkP superfamily pyrophosphatase or phosphodiesterase
MRTRPIAAAIAAIAILSFAASAQHEQIPHVVLISLDGLLPSTYTSPAPPAAPTLRKLAAEGSAASGVIGVLPTVTFPSHTTIITGVHPAMHGVLDNRIVDPEGRSRGGWFWYASQIRVPTLIGAARARNLTTAAINWPVTIASDAHYLVPEFERSPHPEGRLMLDAISTPGLLHDVEIERGRPLPWPLDDEARTDIARHALKTHRPQLTVLHLLRTDGAQHDFGPGSPEAHAAVDSVDREVARILQTLEETGMRRGTIVAIVSDHGFLPYERILHPNTLFKQEGLLTVNASGAITAWQAYFHSSGGGGFVYLKDGSPALKERVGSLLARLKTNPEAGVENVWTAADLAKAGAHPEAAFGLDVKNGWYTGSGLDTLVIKTDRVRGGHGFGPARRELHASLILNGPGVPRGSLGVVRMTQIAPTIAQMLGVSLSREADAPLTLGR